MLKRDGYNSNVDQVSILKVEFQTHVSFKREFSLSISEF